MLVIVVAFMLVPKEKVKDNQENTQTTTVQSTEVKNEDDNNSENQKEKEPFGGIKIGTCNFIILIVLGTVLAVNKYKEIKAGQSQEKE